MGPSETSQRNKSPATPDPEVRLRKVSTAGPGGGRHCSGTGPAGAQAEGRPEALQSSGLLPGLGCSPVGAWGSLPESQTSQHRKRVHRFIRETAGTRGQRVRGHGKERSSSWVRPEAKTAEGRSPSPGCIPFRCDKMSRAEAEGKEGVVYSQNTRGPATEALLFSASSGGGGTSGRPRGLSGSPWGPPSTSPGCRNPLRRWC